MSESTAESKRRQPNRLAGETSPYLLQHAENPVDWYPWGEEALRVARETNRPIFLSVGYSACHWCHVMEHESFEDEEIAALMNQYFVNIKVDREERPDLDQLYMNSVQLMTGRGGWPMSVFLTPDLKPFFGGTYWPPQARMGLPGFKEILQKVHEAWIERREELNQGAEELTQAMVQMSLPQAEETALDESVLQAAVQQLSRAADRNNGGFGRAPKFPHPMDLKLLLRAWKRFQLDDALSIVRLTLDKMARGGIYDHLGGGFHRYSTDARWLVPHFEKMLYDNALLASAYLEAYQATGESDYAHVVRETLDYVLREMTQPQGGFYSTQDADSEGVEGKFFVWSEDEVLDVLGRDDAKIFNSCYDVTASGNWEWKNILNRPKPHDEAAAALKIDPEELSDILQRCRQKLFEVRSQRVAPGRDDKVLVAWNGLMISAMARAGQVLEDDRYTDAARAAADFILDNMRHEDGTLLHTYKDGQSRFTAYLDDYACLIDALVDLYEATFEAKYVQSAVDLAEHMMKHFQDETGGGFFYTAADQQDLIVRNKDSQDTATPSGNGMAATALLRLGRLCSRTDLEDQAVGTLKMLSGQMLELALASAQALIALDYLLGPSYEVVLADGESPQENSDVLHVLHHNYLPNKVVARRPRNLGDDELSGPLKLLLQGKAARESAATIYLCDHGQCQEPVLGVEGLRQSLGLGAKT